jgi:hypothetical protein
MNRLLSTAEMHFPDPPRRDDLKWTQQTVRKLRDEILQTQNLNGWKTAR